MKNVRQVAILDIIEKNSIETQEELAQQLRERGIQVTQATVSRDIKELRLVKVLTSEGGYRYATAESGGTGLVDRFRRMLSECLLSVAASDNLVVVKTLNGSASAAAEAMDNLHWPDILGTLAGDNTIFLVIRSDAVVPKIVDQLRSMIK